MNCSNPKCGQPFTPVAPGQDECLSCMTRPTRVGERPKPKEEEAEPMEPRMRKCARAGCEILFKTDPKQPRRLYCEEHFVGGAARDKGKSHKSREEQAGVESRRRGPKPTHPKGSVPNNPKPPPVPEPKSDKKSWSLCINDGRVHTLEVEGSNLYLRGEGMKVRVLEK